MNKYLLLVLIGFASSVSWASNHSQKVNRGVDFLLAQIQNVQIAINKSLQNRGGPDKTSVCTAVGLISNGIAELNSAVRENTSENQLGDEIVAQLQKDFEYANTFCVPNEGMDPNLKVYNYESLMIKLRNLGNLGLSLRQE